MLARGVTLMCGPWIWTRCHWAPPATMTCYRKTSGRGPLRFT